MTTKTRDSVKLFAAGLLATLSFDGTTLAMAVDGNTVLSATTAGVSMSGGAIASLLPDADATYDLGSGAAQWRDAFLSRDLTISNGRVVVAKTDAAATALGSGTYYGVQAAVTHSTTAIVSGNARAGRFGLTLSGTVTGGAYIIGLQGKLTVSGTMNHADSRFAAVFAQLDTTGATLTTGQISGLWVDHGAGITGAGGGQFNMVRITNTVSGSKPNAIIYVYSDATYLMELDGPGSTYSYVVAAGVSSGSFGNADGVATKVIKISLGGTLYYIPAHTQNT